MPSPTSATLRALITQHCAALAAIENYPAIADALNAPTAVANPVKGAPKVPKPLTLYDVFQAVAAAAPADLAKSKDIPDWMIDRAELAMQQEDRGAMANWLVSIGAAAGLTKAATDALAALLLLTIDDPTWTATVAGPSLAQTAGLGVLTPAHVQAALLGI
jgi:hypothetical protein